MLEGLKLQVPARGGRAAVTAPMLEGLKLVAGQTASTTVFLEAGATARWRFKVAGASSEDVSYTIVLRRLGRATATEEVVIVPETWHGAIDGMCIGDWTNRNSSSEDVVLVMTWSNEHSWFKDKTIYFDVGRQRVAELAAEPATPPLARAAVRTATKVTPLPAPSLESAFKVGEAVYYKGFFAARIEAVHEAGSEDPFYTISCEGREKQTTGSRLSREAEPRPGGVQGEHEDRGYLEKRSRDQVPTAASDALRVRVGALESLLERLQRPAVAAVADEAWLDGAAVEASSTDARLAAAAAEAIAGVTVLRRLASEATAGVTVQCNAPAALPMPPTTLRVITPVSEPRAFGRLESR